MYIVAQLTWCCDMNACACTAYIGLHVAGRSVVCAWGLPLGNGGPASAAGASGCGGREVAALLALARAYMHACCCVCTAGTHPNAPASPPQSHSTHDSLASARPASRPPVDTRFTHANAPKPWTCSGPRIDTGTAPALLRRRAQASSSPSSRGRRRRRRRGRTGCGALRATSGA